MTQYEEMRIYGNAIRKNKMKNTKPTKEDVSKFLEQYKHLMELKKEYDKKLKELEKECKRVDRVAEKLYDYANDKLFYNAENGMLRCVSPSILDKITKTEFLRDYSYDSFN